MYWLAAHGVTLSVVWQSQPPCPVSCPAGLNIVLVRNGTVWWPALAVSVESKATENHRTSMCSPFPTGDIQWSCLLYTATGFNKIHTTGVSPVTSTTFSNLVEITNWSKNNISERLMAKCRQKTFSRKPVSSGDQAKKDAVEWQKHSQKSHRKNWRPGKCVSQWTNVWFMQEKLESGETTVCTVFRGEFFWLYGYSFSPQWYSVVGS